jgi:hypothetical protein
MSDPEREDWTLRWADGRPFDVDDEASRFMVGLRGRVKLIFPKLAGWMEYGERLEATGSGLGTGSQTTGLFVATDRALIVLVIGDKHPQGHPEHLVDSMRIPYADVEQYAWERRRPLPFYPKLGFLQLRTKDAKALLLGQIVARQADVLAGSLERHMPAGALQA